MQDKMGEDCSIPLPENPLVLPQLRRIRAPGTRMSVEKHIQEGYFIKAFFCKDLVRVKTGGVSPLTS